MYIASLILVDRMGDTVDDVVAINVGRTIIFADCSETVIALIPTGIYFCVGKATFTGISELCKLKRFSESSGRNHPRKRRKKKGTGNEKEKSKFRRDHARSMTVHRCIVEYDFENK